MKSQITHLVWKRLLFIALIAFFAIQTHNASATHFRYGNLTWSRVPGSANKIQFKASYVFRHSHFASDPVYPYQVGSVFASNFFNPGFGSNTFENVVVTAVDLKNDLIQVTWSKVVTYSTPGNYVASTPNFCCRIISPRLENNPNNAANTQHILKTVVQVGAGFNNNNDAPVSAIPHMINFPEHTSVVTYQFPAADPNGDALTFSLSPNGSFGNVSIQPSGLTISPTGLITWSTTNIDSGKYYYASVRITDAKGVYTTTDFMIKITGQSTPSVFDTSAIPNGSIVEIQPGDSIDFKFKTTDPDAGDTVTLSAAGIPLGAEFTTSGTNPTEGTFVWVPADSQQGTYVINITSEDEVGIQTSTSFTLDVSYKPRFDLGTVSNPLTPGNNSVLIVKPGDTLVHPVIAYHPTVTDGVIMTVASGLAPGMTFTPSFPLAIANPVPTSFSWTPTLSQWGLHRVDYKAEDTFYRQVAYDTIYYIVDNPPFITSNPPVYAYVGQLYNYLLTATDLDIPYGDVLDVEEITKPGFLAVTDNHNATFNIAGIPGNNDIGTHSIAIEVADSFNHFGGTHYGNAMQLYDLIVLAMPEVSGVVSHVTINGQSTGGVNITPTGGKGPYTYVWSNNATTEDLAGVPAGIYYVTVTDSLGMTASDTFVVNQPAPLTVPGNVTHVTINGQSTGAVNTTPAGGVGPYTYSWSNSVITEDLTGVPTGSYTITVTDANGATASNTFVVNQPDPLTVPGNITHVTINGQSTGAVNVTATGGVGPYTYSWSNSATTEDLTGVPAGSYTVTVTDANGATAQNTFVVNQPAPLSIPGTVTHVGIYGQSTGKVNTTPTGGVGPYTFSCNNGATTKDLIGVPAGSYTVTVRDANGATAQNTFVVNQPPALVISGTVTNVTTFGGNNGSINITVTGGVGPYTYSWSNNTTAEDPTGLVAGTYSVTVTDANGATKTASYTVTQPSAPQFPMISTCTFPYVITLESVTLVSGKYEWIWSVRNPNPGNGKNGTVQDLSHWNITLGNCASFSSITSAATSSNGTSWSSFTPTYKADPSIGNGVKVVKFDVGTSGSAKKYYKIVTTQNLTVNNQSTAYYKSGGNTGSGTICFPGFGCNSGNKGLEEEVITAKELKLYPNPTTGMFTIDLPGAVLGGDVLVMDMGGKLIQRVQFAPDSKLNIDLGNAPKGTYMIRVINGTEFYNTRVLVN